MRQIEITTSEITRLALEARETEKLARAQSDALHTKLLHSGRALSSTGASARLIAAHLHAHDNVNKDPDVLARDLTAILIVEAPPRDPDFDAFCPVSERVPLLLEGEEPWRQKLKDWRTQTRAAKRGVL